jgi:DNA-binding ferritin-like protein
MASSRVLFDSSADGRFMPGAAEWTQSQQPAEYYRAAAARARSLEQEATTPRVKQHLRELIERYDRLAGEIERTSDKDADGESVRFP